MATSRKKSSANSQVSNRVGQAALSVLRPLARLFLAHGLAFQQAETLLKRAFFEASEKELSRAGIKTNVSRISVSTGLHRRDVKQFTNEDTETVEKVSAERSMAAEFYIRWSADQRLARRKYILPIRAIGKQLSFEKLAREISSDAHPRSLLEELSRLGLLEEDEQRSEVKLKPGGFVPILQRSELLDLLGENVSAHLDTAVSNVVEEGNKYLEQAITEEGLSPQSIERMNKLVRRIWLRATKEIVAALSREQSSARTQRTKQDNGGDYAVRIGMFMHTSLPRSETIASQRHHPSPPAKATKRRNS